MIADLKSYPKMKDSGVPWLGEVPEHWSIDRLKSSVSNVIEQTAERRSDELYVALEHVESWTGRIRRAQPDVTFDSQVKRFRTDDVLFGKLRPYLAKVTRAPGDGVCVGEFLVLRPRESGHSARYLEQLLRSRPVIDAVNASTFGAKMPRADWQFVGTMPITLPPLPEQTAIVRFLDYMDRRIRRYIRAKQKLIKLLEEQKQAIIHRAVTRGLDPNVRLKPSGVEWLGDVPEHWNVVPLRWYASIGSGDFIATDDVSSTQSKHHCLPVVGGNGIMGYSAGSNSDGKTIVIGRVGALCGNVHLISGRAWITDNALKIKHLRGFEPEYLAIQLKLIDLNRFANANAQPLITGGTVKEQRVLQVSREEQYRIVQAVQQVTSTADVAINSIRREIDLLREYRTRLIADVVTGKLDVREAAAQLPEETDAPEPSEVADAFDEPEEAAEVEDATESEEMEA